MRFLIATTFFVISVSAATCPPNEEKFVKSLKTMLQVPDKYLNFDDLRKMLVVVIDALHNLKPMTEIGKYMKDHLLKIIPFARLPELQKLMKKADDECFKKVGTDTLKAADKATPAFYITLETPYKLVIAKIKSFKDSKKSKAVTMEAAFEVANQWVNKGNVTNVVKAARAQMPCPEWKCAQVYLPPLLNITIYDTSKEGTVCKK